MCRHVDIRGGAPVAMGAVIGDESVVGAGRARRAPTCRSSRTSASSPQRNGQHLAHLGVAPASRSLFGDAGVQGLVGVDITPELALKVAEAYGTMLPKGGHVVITPRHHARGAHAQARHDRRAERGRHQRARPARRVAGGQPLHHAEDALRGRRPPLRIDARSRSRSRSAFFDRNGLDIAPWEQKKIERLYFREEFRRAFFDEIGDIMYPPRPLEYYGAALNEAMDEADLGDEWRKVVADMAGGPATFILPQVAHGWHLNLIALNGVVDSEATSAPSEEPDGRGRSAS